MSGLIRAKLEYKECEDSNKPLRTLIYLRVSTDRQAAKEFSSVDAQRVMVEEYAKQHPRIQIVGEYSDAKSAKNMNRDGYQEMLSRIKRGDIDAVISYKNDRVCRNRQKFDAFKAFLLEYKVRLLYSNDYSSDGSPTGDFVEGITAELSEMERKKIAERTADKYLQNLKRGYRSGGIPPIGYKLGSKPCEMVIDAPNADIIKKIFSQFMRGEKPSRIASNMNADYGKVPERQTRSGRKLGGKPFNEKVIRNILDNPTYAGYVYIDMGTQGGRREVKLFDGVHTPIINKADWQKVHDTLWSFPTAKKTKTPFNLKNLYPLKGIIRCDCGSFMTGAYTCKHGRIHKYYICARKNKEHSACDCKTMVSQAAIEGVLFSALAHFMRHKIEVGKMSSDYDVKVRAKLSAKRIARNRLREKVDTATREMFDYEKDDPIRNAIALSVRTMAEDLKKLETEVDDLENENKAMNDPLGIKPMRIKEALKDFDLIQQNLTDEEKLEIVNRAISCLVLRCVQHHHRLEREMVLSVYPKSEFTDIIPRCDIRFTVNTSSGKSIWEITSPFKLSCTELLNPPPEKRIVKTGRHFIHEVFKWKEKIDSEKISLREFCRRNSYSPTVLSQKLTLLKKLSPEVLRFILELRDKAIINKISHRYLLKLGKVPIEFQEAKIRQYCDIK